MSSDTGSIQTGPEIVSLFLESLEGDFSFDPNTVACIRDLSRAEKLTKTRLMQALERVRSDEQSSSDIESK
jgi:hypothetical protein